MAAFSTAAQRLTAASVASDDVFGVDDVSTSVSKGMLAGEVASLPDHLGSTRLTNNTNTPAYVDRAATTSATPAAGFGYGWRITVQTAASNSEVGGAWRLELTDATSTSEDFKWVGSVMIAGAAATDVAELDKDGFNAPTGKVYKVAGVQVVGPRGALIADASGGATVDAEARTAINALLARCRTHGLIAT